MLPKLPVPSTLAYILVIFVNSAKLCLNQNTILLPPKLPTAAAILFLFTLSTALILLALVGFPLFLSQSEPICNLHWCYTTLHPCYVLCTPFLANQNHVIFVCILLKKLFCDASKVQFQILRDRNTGVVCSCIYTAQALTQYLL